MENKDSKNYQVTNAGAQEVKAPRPQTHTGGATVRRGTDLRTGGSGRSK